MNETLRNFDKQQSCKSFFFWVRNYDAILFLSKKKKAMYVNIMISSIYWNRYVHSFLWFQQCKFSMMLSQANLTCLQQIIYCLILSRSWKYSYNSWHSLKYRPNGNIWLKFVILFFKWNPTIANSERTTLRNLWLPK